MAQAAVFAFTLVSAFFKLVLGNLFWTLAAGSVLSWYNGHLGAMVATITTNANPLSLWRQKQANAAFYAAHVDTPVQLASNLSDNGTLVV